MVLSLVNPRSWAGGVSGAARGDSKHGGADSEGRTGVERMAGEGRSVGGEMDCEEGERKLEEVRTKENR